MYDLSDEVFGCLDRFFDVRSTLIGGIVGWKILVAEISDWVIADLIGLGFDHFGTILQLRCRI